jgi:tetratricopeptide (TPR) repeat protein
MRRLSLFFSALLAAGTAAAGRQADPQAPARAESLLSEGHPAEARRVLEPYLAAKKDAASAWVLLGRADYAEGRKSRAADHFTRALKADPHCAAAYLWRGKLFEEKGKLDEAANEYQAAIKADPSDAQAQAAWKALSEKLTVSDAK